MLSIEYEITNRMRISHRLEFMVMRCMIGIRGIYHKYLWSNFEKFGLSTIEKNEKIQGSDWIAQ